ncbi:hypothetical protein OHA72_49065 [Dactylosporangium sp. NBC_01737]|uniref:hypothetical protein n=1 Tax=Dactylosporangium sp. NBC_01737 TaxID=2975959 RepID=UPI002E13CD26|nr:hypothetical protein OHA72_49065 [Dactylosporangium sp. NBC_01737]
MRATTVIAVITSAFLLTACTSPDHQSGDAAPAGSAAAPTTSAVTSAATSAAPSTTAAASAGPSTGATATPTLGPLGYGALRLGMTKEQALATGLVTAFDESGCPQAHVKGLREGQGWVVLSPRLGIAAIQAWPTLATAEGVRAGMSAVEVRRIYPNMDTADGDLANGRHYPKVPGNDKAVYRIATHDGKVSDVTLQLARQDCYE